MFTVTEDYEDEFTAFHAFPSSTEQTAFEQKVKAEQMNREEFESHTLREIEERLAEMEEGDEADNFLLN